MAKSPKATVKPLHNLAGSSGNLQDVSDLEQMLAQSQTELATAKEQISALKSKIEDAQRAARNHIEALESRPMRERSVDALIEVRRAIKAGRVEDALYELEREMSSLNSSWRIAA